MCFALIPFDESEIVPELTRERSPREDQPTTSWDSFIVYAIVEIFVYSFTVSSIDLFADTAAILDSIVSDIYYGMLRGQIHTNLLPEHPIITI